MVRHFVEVCIRRGLKINAGKSKVMVLNEGERLECEVCVYRMQLEHVLEFKYFGCVLDESGTDETEWRMEGTLQVLSGLCSLSVLGSCMRH